MTGFGEDKSTGEKKLVGEVRAFASFVFLPGSRRGDLDRVEDACNLAMRPSINGNTWRNLEASDAEGLLLCDKKTGPQRASTGAEPEQATSSQSSMQAPWAFSSRVVYQVIGAEPEQATSSQSSMQAPGHPSAFSSRAVHPVIGAEPEQATSSQSWMPAPVHPSHPEFSRPTIMIPPDNALEDIAKIPSSETNSVASPAKPQKSNTNLIATSRPVHETHGEVQTKMPDDTKGGCYISGGGNFRTFIDIVSLVLVLYCTVAVPYDMSFEPPKGLAMRGVDVGIEIFFICEMFLNFFTSYYIEDGSEVKSLRQTAIKYAKTWLLMDAASSVPAETASMIAEALARGTSNGSDVSSLTQLKIIRMLRLAKLLRLVKIARILEDIEFNFPFLIVYIGLSRLFCIMLIVAHFNACMFYWLGKMNIGNSWISKYNYGCCDTNIPLFAEQRYGESGTACFDPSLLPGTDVLYVNSMYWSITTLATIGYGDITPCNELEMLFVSMSHILGSALFAYVVGGIATIAMTKNGQELKKKEKQNQLQEYLELRQVPKALRNKIQRQNYRKWNSIVFDEEALMKDFSAKMRQEVVKYAKDEIMQKIPLVSHSPDFDFRIDLVCAFKPMSVVVQGDEIEPEIIVDFNDARHDMYVVTNGQVELWLKDRFAERGVLVESLAACKLDNPKCDLPCVNELGMLAKEPSCEQVRASSRTPTSIDLLHMRRSDFDKVIKNYTSSTLHIEDRIQKERDRLLFLLNKADPDNEEKRASSIMSPKSTFTTPKSSFKTFESSSIPTKTTESMNSAKYLGAATPGRPADGSTLMNSAKYLGAATPGRPGTSVELDDLKMLAQSIMKKQEWFEQCYYGIIKNSPRQAAPESSSLPSAFKFKYADATSSAPEDTETILLNIADSHWV